MTKGLTKRDMFGMLFDVVCEADTPNRDMLCDFITYEVALLDRKAGTPKRNLEAEAARKAVSEVLRDATEPMRAGEVADKAGISIQRATAALTALRNSGEVKRLEDGKVAKFTI